ncbi:MAG: hypothetical protein ACI4J1_10630 [Ruminiclostridium sp.]
MTLFHNADINDLNSILASGLLPSSETGKDNWESGKRADNSKDRVYMFSPIEGKPNTFVNYGAALIKLNVEAAEKSNTKDAHKNDYEEFTADRVSAEQIEAIYLPKILMDRISGLSTEVLDKVVWCGMTAEIFDHCEPDPNDKWINRTVYRQATAEELKAFSQTANLSVSALNYFRGVSEHGMIDLYNVWYVF